MQLSTHIFPTINLHNKDERSLFGEFPFHKHQVLMMDCGQGRWARTTQFPLIEKKLYNEAHNEDE